MGYISYALLLTWTCLSAHFLLNRFAWFRDRLLAQDSSKYPGLDALRGLLATGVLFSHIQVFETFRTKLLWSAPADSVFRFMGNGCVMIFFLITGFLFWTKAIEAKGRLSVLKLYMNRLRRIAPLYLLHVAILLITVGFISRWKLLVDPTVLREELLSILSLGFVIWNELNTQKTVLISGGMAWSLSYEWWFYLSLPLLALLVRSNFALIGFALLFFLVGPSLPSESVHLERATAFLFGMAVAHVVDHYKDLPEIRGPWVTCFLLLALNTSIFGLRNQTTTPALLVSSVLLVAVLYGNTLFGLLEQRTLKFLGMISYSVYLMHGFILAGFGGILKLGYVAGSPIPGWWNIPVAVLCCPCVVLVSMATYRWVEYPFLTHRKLAAPR